MSFSRITVTFAAPKTEKPQPKATLYETRQKPFSLDTTEYVAASFKRGIIPDGDSPITFHANGQPIPSVFCRHRPSYELNCLLWSLIEQLHFFEVRAKQNDPHVGKSKRRLVCGLREALKNAHKIKCLLLAVDLTPHLLCSPEFIQLMTAVEANEIPIMWGLTKRWMGEAMALPHGNAGVVAVLNADGAHEIYLKCITMSIDLGNQWNEAAVAHLCNGAIEDSPKYIHTVCYYGNLRLLTTLYEKNPEMTLKGINWVDSTSGNNGLLFAVGGAATRHFVKYLIRDLNIASTSRNFAHHNILHLAALANRDDISVILAQADLESLLASKDLNGEDPMTLAMKYHSTDFIVSVLKAHPSIRLSGEHLRRYANEGIKDPAVFSLVWKHRDKSTIDSDDALLSQIIRTVAVSDNVPILRTIITSIDKSKIQMILTLPEYYDSNRHSTAFIAANLDCVGAARELVRAGSDEAFVGFKDKPHLTVGKLLEIRSHSRKLSN